MSSQGFNWLYAQYFHRYALTKSMQQTATFFDVAPSTISRCLKKFEDEHGALLFRDMNKVTLTEQGLALWPHLDRLFDTLQRTKVEIAQEQGTQLDVILGLPEIIMKPYILSQIHQRATAHGIRVIPTGGASYAAIEFGEPHLGLVIDRPCAQQSLAETTLIGGTRYDVCHAIYQSALEFSPHVLVGSYGDVEWEEIARRNYFNLDHARHNSMCAPMSESTREYIATLGMGLVVLPIHGKANDPTLTEMTEFGRFPLYSLNLVMHPAYRKSAPHSFIRDQLVQILGQSAEAFYEGLASVPPGRPLPPS